MSKYELQMLEQKRKDQEMQKTKRKVGMIISIVFIVAIIAMVAFVLKDKVKESINTVDKSLEEETPKSKG
jgi:NADH:ubiquinone oxidoreductase subunit 6 (subunit J)